MMKQPYKENCKWYDYWQDMGARIPICKAGKNMDESGTYLMTCDGCEEYGSKYIITNADRIRNMTDEELAKFIERTMFMVYEAVAKVCRIVGYEGQWDSDGVVREELEWLKQEVD